MPGPCQILTNAKRLATRQRFRGTAVDAALKAEARAYGELVRTRAIALSQGTISRKALRAYKPGLYSRGRAGNPLFDAVINKQSGIFAASWRLGVYTFAGHITVTVSNAAPYSRFMQGTDKSRKRPILNMATGQGAIFRKAILDAKRRAERANTGGSLPVALIAGGGSGSVGRSSPGTSPGGGSGNSGFASLGGGFGSLGADLVGIVYSVGSAYLSGAMNS